MPTATLKSLAKKYKVSLSSAEDCWEKAKSIAEKKFEHGTDDFWKYVTGITKNCLKNKSKSKPKYKDW